MSLKMQRKKQGKPLNLDRQLQDLETEKAEMFKKESDASALH
jgi:hypothetical protein